MKLVAIKVQPRIKKATEIKGIIGNSRGNIDVIPPIKNETLDVMSRQIFINLSCQEVSSCLLRPHCLKWSVNDHIFKASESALSIVLTIVQYKLKEEIFRANAAVYPIKEAIDSAVTKHFE